MIVNLYVDHMMSQPATSSDDVSAATQDRSALFAEAARKIGLTPSEYREFRASLLDGERDVLEALAPRRRNERQPSWERLRYKKRRRGATGDELARAAKRR